ncbi:MAG: nuclear transport factor 2 family protein [Microcystaceae cyanobacterium]
MMRFPLSAQPVVQSLAFGLGLTIALNFAPRLQAAEPSTAPPQLTNLITKIDATANQHNVEQLRQFYSPTFTNSDGLNLAAQEVAIASLWKRYPDLTYKTQRHSWEKNGDNFIAQTVTKIEGKGQWQGSPANFKGEIQSRQTFQGDKLLRQEILSEKTTLTTGSNPPEVDIRLPQTVRPGQEFDFDVILRDPIGNSLLAGTAIAQEIDKENYINPVNLDLELLQSGGLFKRAKAPNKPEDRWLSAVLISPDGVLWVTQRLRVEK